MRIIFYKFNQEMVQPKKIQVEVVQLEGTFRYPLDILNPVVDVFTDLAGNISIPRLIQYNYMSIPAIGRGYFIDNYIIKNYIDNNNIQHGDKGSIITFYLKIDVLGTYYDYLKTCKAFVARNELTYNEKIYDEVMPVKATPTITYQYLDNESITEGFTFSGNAFVAAIITDDTSDNYGGVYNPTSDIKTNIGYSYVNAGSNVRYYVLFTWHLKGLLAAVYNNDTLLGYIKHITYLPIQHDIPSFESLTSNVIRVGNQNITVASGGTYPYVLKYAARLMRQTTLQLVLDDKYINYKQFLKIELLLPFYGFIELNFEDVNNKTIRIDYFINFDTGEVVVYIWNSTDNVILFSAPCQCGYKVPVSSANNLEWQTTRDNLTRTGVVRGISSAVTGLAGIGFMTNPFTFPMGAGMTLGAGVGAMETAVDIYNKNASNYHTAKSELSGDMSSVMNNFKVLLKLTRTEPLLYGDSSYAHVMGLPLYQTTTLSTLEDKGFTVIKDIKLDGAIESSNTTIYGLNTTYTAFNKCRATKAEIDMLYDKVKGGIIL